MSYDPKYCWVVHSWKIHKEWEKQSICSGGFTTEHKRYIRFNGWTYDFMKSILNENELLYINWVWRCKNPLSEYDRANWLKFYYTLFYIKGFPELDINK